MKNTTLKTGILISFGLLASIAGCRKDAMNPPVPDDLYLSKVYVGGNLTTQIDYDEVKRIASIQRYTNGQIDDSEYWEYNEAGQVSQRWFMNADKTLQVIWVYEYDSNGKISNRLVYPNIFSPTSQSTYAYDGRGRVATQYDHNTPSDLDQITSYIQYEYDDEGNPTVMKGYTVGQNAPDVLYVDIRYEYDNPKQAAKARNRLGRHLADYVALLFSSRTYTSYTPAGAISAANTITIDTDFNASGLPVKSAVESDIIHPNPGNSISDITYEYTDLSNLDDEQ